jgi:hypothetical protein
MNQKERVARPVRNGSTKNSEREKREREIIVTIICALSAI